MEKIVYSERIRELADILARKLVVRKAKNLWASAKQHLVNVQAVEKGLIDSNDEKVPYLDTWEDLLKKIAERPTQPLQPSDPLTPYVNPQSPFLFPTITAYGCESVQGPLGGVAQWDGTTALGYQL